MSFSILDWLYTLERVGETGGGGGTKHLVLYGEAQPLTCTFYIPSIYKWYPFHIPTSSLELCIPFNCCKSNIFEI